MFTIIFWTHLLDNFSVVWCRKYIQNAAFQNTLCIKKKKSKILSLLILKNQKNLNCNKQFINFFLSIPECIKRRIVKWKIKISKSPIFFWRYIVYHCILESDMSVGCNRKRKRERTQCIYFKFHNSTQYTYNCIKSTIKNPYKQMLFYFHWPAKLWSMGTQSPQSKVLL